METADNRLSLIEQTSTNADVRDAATDALKALDEWSVGIDYREDVYRVLKTWAATAPALAGEDQKLFTETLRDFTKSALKKRFASLDDFLKRWKSAERGSGGMFPIRLAAAGCRHGARSRRGQCAAAGCDRDARQNRTGCSQAQDRLRRCLHLEGRIGCRGELQFDW